MPDTATTSTDAACPANHTSWSSILSFNNEKETTSQHTNACPVDHKNLPSVISESCGCDSSSLINESNNMLLYPDQKPAKGQHIPLSTTRELSSIPRLVPENNNNCASGNNKELRSTEVCNEEKVWIYPSEQMFFNAMKRKNWNPKEEDMRVIIPMHNAVNEKAWKEILEWERLHENKCGGPKLVKFQGKARNITPKARLFNLFGYKLPFDRHDWVVDRCGKRVTYIIDFYSGQPDPKFPQAVSFYLDVRPALTFDGALDRLRRWTYDFKMNWMN